MHGIAAITVNMHRSLRYFALFERTTSYGDDNKSRSKCCVSRGYKLPSLAIMTTFAGVAEAIFHWSGKTFCHKIHYL